MTRLCFLLAALAALCPLRAEFPASRFLDEAIEEAIRKDQIPGAVLWIGHRGQVLHRKAYGQRALEPQREAMTLDTIFDAASLTKVVATTSAVMKLFEQGRLRLNDPVTAYLPEFQGGKSAITVRSLLTHFSGLRPDVDLKPAWSGYETGIKLALVDRPVVPPGESFIYSDINFVLLGEIVRRLSGRPLPDYVREEIFEPLGMRESRFQPPAEWRGRIAPTERLAGQAEPLRGVVHDPTTRYMAGIAGHAGLFTTAADLAIFAEMMIGKGERNGDRVFQAVTVEKFTTPQSPPNQAILRGLGWDIDSPFSGNRGELFPLGSYGHTGFTGTSLWIDPFSETYVILLANSVHPKVRPAITSLRGRVGTIAAAAVPSAGPLAKITGYNEAFYGAGARRKVNRNGEALTGLDVLAEQAFRPLAGKRVGLITNHTGVDRQGVPNWKRMREAGVNLVALLAPEHGLFGVEDKEDIGHGRHAETGVPVWSLYAGKDRRPTDAMLAGLEALVYDVQDVGARFYTYTTTMAFAMEEAAKRRIPFWVLDRPNPINGVSVEGPMLETELLSFVGYFPLPLRHGMTIGELARMFNEENGIHAELQVIRMADWQRGDWFDQTGLPWIDPSPNLRSLNGALLYPGIAMLEYSKNYSVGRGTDAPFEQIGAEWIAGPELARHLNKRNVPGVRAYPVTFTPSAPPLAGSKLEGVRFVVTDREQFNSARLGLEVAYALGTLYPGRIAWGTNEKLIGSRQVIDRMTSGQDARLIEREFEGGLRAFLARRQRYLLYPEN